MYWSIGGVFVVIILASYLGYRALRPKSRRNMAEDENLNEDN
jgi:hypothetical protein